MTKSKDISRREHNEDIRERRRPYRRAFVDALQVVLDSRGLSHRDLQSLSGWNCHQTMYPWVKLTSEPRPDEVFHIERSLDLDPGTLSSYLGYKPLQAGDLRPHEGFGHVINNDPFLDDKAKELLQMIYEHLTDRLHRHNRHREDDGSAGS